MFTPDTLNQFDTPQVSPATRRAAAHEWELSHVVLNTVFMARDTQQLRQLLEAQVYAHKYYDKLPKYRQLALEAYFRGVCDAVARFAGATVPLVAEKPKSIPPVRKNKPRAKRVSKTPAAQHVPVMYPTNPPTSPLPGWITPTIIPPPTVHQPASPFPPAVQ